MKLIYCPKCHDLRGLDYQVASCKCGASKGWYDADGESVTIQGEAIPIMFLDSTFIGALRSRSSAAENVVCPFEAFTLPEGYPTVTKLDN